jgi:uroporphyrinogen-III synthase
MTDNSLNVLITRPAGKAQALALLLKQQGIFAISQPLFDYQAYASSQDIKGSINSADILIFVSVAAVEFAHASYPLSINSDKIVIAVGQATKRALQTIGITNVLTSTQENSEGLLKLDQLCQVKDKNITIVRGNGGREHLATTLTERGAQVCYIESYQRVWRTLTKNIAKQWQEQQINCIVVTSNDILLTLVNLVIHTEKTNTDINNKLNDNNYWQNDCCWLVASQRIADSAKALGLTQVININGANDQVIIEQLQKL